VICIPTTPIEAPPRDLGVREMRVIDLRLVRLTCFAGLTGRPQITIPMIRRGGLRLGMSIVGPTGSDRALLRLAAGLARMMEDAY
jgi:amidase